MIPVRPRWSALDPGPQRDDDRHVFVPMVLGAGIVVSVVLLLSDAVAALRGRNHGRLRARRRSLLVARDLAEPIGGAKPPPATRLRMRGTYSMIGVAVAAFAVYVLVGATWNYWDPYRRVQWSEGVAWLWLTISLCGLAAVAGGAVVLRLATRHRRCTTLLLPWVLDTPLGRRNTDLADSPAPRP